MVATFAALAPVVVPAGLFAHAKALKQQWRALLVIGAAAGLNIALNNMSLVYITLSLNQVIR
jgi:solute carrier family 35 protein E4